MVALALTLTFLASIAISALVGLFRGVGKSVIRLITLLLAVVLTFVVAGPVVTQIAQNIQMDGQNLGEMMLASAREMEMVGDILDAAPLLQEAILVAPAFVLSIIVFPVVFSVLNFVSWIIFLCVQKPLRRLIFREGEDLPKPSFGARIGKRFAGLAVGIITGVLIFGMFASPLLGLVSVMPNQHDMEQTLDIAVEQDYLSAADADAVQMVYEVTDSPAVQFCDAMGVTAAGRKYLSSVSGIEAEGQQTCLTDEFDALLAVFRTAMEGGLVDALLDTENQDALYAVLADEEFMDALMQDMFRSKLLRSAVPEVMAIAMENAAAGMNVPADKDAVYDKMMDGVALAVQNADIDYAGIKAYEDAHFATYRLFRSASTTHTAEDLLTEAEYKEETRKLAELTDLISFVIDVAVSGDNEEFADQVALSIVDQIKAQVSENGQEVLTYYDAASVRMAISNIDAAELALSQGDAAQMLQQLTDKEKFETDMATLETIKETIRTSVKDAMADDTKAAETASTLATIVSDFTAAISSATNADGSVDIAKLDYGRIANAVTTLQHSPLKDVGTSLLDMVASGDMANNSMVSGLMAVVKEGYENGKDIGGAIKAVGALVKLNAALNGEEEPKPEAKPEVGGETGGQVGGETGGQVGGETGGQVGGETGGQVGGETGGQVGGETGSQVGGETGGQAGSGSDQQQEAVVDSLVSLIENLNEFTIELLPTVLSPDTFVSMGIPAEYADATYSVFETLLKELVKLQDEADYEAEVNSILSLYALATHGVDQFTEADVQKLVHYAIESDTIFNTLVSISVSNPFGIQIEDAAVRDNIADAIEGFYAQSGRTQRERELCCAVARLLGIDGEVNLG